MGGNDSGKYVGKVGLGKKSGILFGA